VVTLKDIYLLIYSFIYYKTNTHCTLW